MARLRSTHDREILRLAVPALGALAAEPLYLLTDTAIVGHLGTVELAALALAATLLSALVTLCNFLTYGTTARVARLRGAGSDLVARGFTGDDAVLERAEVMWPLFALLQPVGAAVFALDGILIGAEDTRFIKWSMVFAALGVFVPICLLSLELDWGIVGVWCGLNALMVARRRRWARASPAGAGRWWGRPRARRGRVRRCAGGHGLRRGPSAHRSREEPRPRRRRR